MLSHALFSPAAGSLLAVWSLMYIYVCILFLMISTDGDFSAFWGTFLLACTLLLPLTWAQMFLAITQTTYSSSCAQWLAGCHFLFVGFLQRCQGELNSGVIMDTCHKMGSRGGYGMGVPISMGSCMVKVLEEQTVWKMPGWYLQSCEKSEMCERDCGPWC